MSHEIEFELNGEMVVVAVNAEDKLLDVVRRLGCKSVKYGCGEGACGACTVLLNGKPVYSCILYAFQADGGEVWTVEGVSDFDRPHPVQKALAEAGAVQCGYCIPGMVLSAKAMFDEIYDPSDDDIREHMDGNLCRCTGYEKIWTALQNVKEQMQAEGAEDE
jgi:carbon-monoxide dehydrogenase small subunit